MAKTLQERIAGEVRAEMARQSVTQAQLAAQIGTDQATLSRKLGGRSPITAKDIDRWATALRVPVSRLVPDGEPAVTP